MKVSVKKVDALRREMSFEVSKERVTQKLDEVLREITRHAKISGFRPGKAPRNLVESVHWKSAREEMIKTLVSEVYQEGLTAENLNSVSYPMIDNVQLKDGVLMFNATIDLRPEFDVNDYKGIRLARKSSDVTEEELNKSLEFIKKSRGMDESVLIDDAFAKNIGFTTLEGLKKALKRNLGFDKEQQNKIDIEHQLVEQLLMKCDFPLPQFIVEHQFNGRMDSLAEQLKQYGTKEDAIAGKLEDASKEIRARAEKDVKSFFILQKIAAKEGIPLAEGDNSTGNTIKFLLKEAQWEEVKA